MTSSSDAGETIEKQIVQYESLGKQKEKHVKDGDNVCVKPRVALYITTCSNTGDSTAVRVDQLHRGTTVQTPTGPRRIAAVVRTNVRRGSLLLCRLGDLVITPWHPVKYTGDGSRSARWAFPAHLVEPQLMLSTLFS
jgi:hypothetical protein